MVASSLIALAKRVHIIKALNKYRNTILIKSSQKPYIMIYEINKNECKYIITRSTRTYWTSNRYLIIFKQLKSNSSI